MVACQILNTLGRQSPATTGTAEIQSDGLRRVRESAQFTEYKTKDSHCKGISDRKQTSLQNRLNNITSQQKDKTLQVQLRLSPLHTTGRDQFSKKPQGKKFYNSSFIFFLFFFLFFQTYDAPSIVYYTFSKIFNFILKYFCYSPLCIHLILLTDFSFHLAKTCFISLAF